MKPYNKRNIPFAKMLRKNMTPWERKLWYEFLCGYSVRFQRQKPIGNYIADFYCARAELVLELDGSGHYDAGQAEKDRARTNALEAMRLKVLRICNIDIDCNFYGVCEAIDLAVKESLPQAALRPAEPEPKGQGLRPCVPPAPSSERALRKPADSDA